MDFVRFNVKKHRSLSLERASLSWHYPTLSDYTFNLFFRAVLLKKIDMLSAGKIVIGILVCMSVTVNIVASTPRKEQVSNAVAAEKNIMLALLLDTSNSMDGLIDQAKSQLWRIVNELAEARCSDGAQPQIRIALYEYGNDNLSAYGGYIRLVAPLTSDLDLISEKLFALRTNGGSEYCGKVINQSLQELSWSSSEADLKMIFIAGNEPFTQGPVPYQEACALANEKGVVVNTIFCGAYTEGVATFWKNGADLTHGTYMNIDQDQRTVYIITPYDARIEILNKQLNDTYIFYGRSGASKKRLQAEQDDNASRYGAANAAERAVSKSSHAYDNSSWDLIDANKKDSKVIENADRDELPEEMKNMSTSERKAFIEKKSKERAQIQKEIQSLNEQRKEYIAQQKKSGQQNETLDDAMIQAIKQKGKSKNFVWK